MRRTPYEVAANASNDGKAVNNSARLIGNMFFVTTRYEVVQMKKLIVAFLKDEEGLTMVEYAIAGALISAAAVLAFTNLGTAVTAKITALTAAVNT